MDKARFVDTVERVFAHGQADSENLWQLAQAAAEQAHRTMLVISDAAAEEAARLSAQAILIGPRVSFSRPLATSYRYRRRGPVCT
jgi:hypothetical protein